MREVGLRSSADAPPVVAVEPVIVGKITAHHGVRGWLKVVSYTRPAEQILEYRRWLLATRRDAGEWRRVRVAGARRQRHKLLAKLDGRDDREACGDLPGNWIAIAPAQLAQLPPGEYYWSDLIGLSVVNQDEVTLGVVDHLLETGANDVLVVRSDSADQAEHLLPWSPEVITSVDVAGGRIRVEWDPQALAD